jgi:hypothetical protein
MERKDSKTDRIRDFYLELAFSLKGGEGTQDYCDSDLIMNVIRKSLEIIAGILNKKDINPNDFRILEELMNIISIIFIFNEEALDYFYKYHDKSTNISMKDIIIKGLTFTHKQEIKTTFYNFVTYICDKIDHTQNIRLPIMVILDICKEHFYESFSEHSRGYGYNDYYNTFSQLIHKYFSVSKTNPKYEDIIEPESFAIEIVEMLKKYKTKEKRNTMLEDHCLIGIFEILQRLMLDNPQYIEKIALEHGLIQEIFFDCLFTEAKEAPKLDVTS